MSDTNTTVIGDTDAQDAIVSAIFRMATRGDGSRGIPVTVWVDDLPGKAVWTITVPQRIGVKSHTVTVISDPFTN